jgi:TonB family protein
MTKFLTLFVAISILACKSQKETYYGADTKEPKTNSPIPDNTVYYVFENGNYVQSELDKKPEPIGGKNLFLKKLASEIRYPVEARQRGVQGDVILNVILNESGKVEEVQIIKGIGFGCDEAALNAWKKATQTGFEPAMKGGKPVKVKYETPVRFKIQ